MCGLSGFFGLGGLDSTEAARGILGSMTNAIVRRGPDSAGHWLDGEAGIALGHRRLAILDLTESGAQPMHSACGRFVIAFNGEIYNHLELRASLEAANVAPAWRGHSDTETLLASFAHWGIRNTLQRAVGMFAFAVWDRRDYQLTLGRDRLDGRVRASVDNHDDPIPQTQTFLPRAGGYSGYPSAQNSQVRSRCRSDHATQVPRSQLPVMHAAQGGCRSHH